MLHSILIVKANGVANLLSRVRNTAGEAQKKIENNQTQNTIYLFLNKRHTHFLHCTVHCIVSQLTMDFNP